MSKPYQTLFLFDMFRKGNILERWCLSYCNIQGTSPILLGSRFAIILFVSFCITLYDTPHKRYQSALYQNVQVGRVCYSSSHCWQCQPRALLNTARGELSRQNIRSCTSYRNAHLPLSKNSFLTQNFRMCNMNMKEDKFRN